MHYYDILYMLVQNTFLEVHLTQTVVTGCQVAGALLLISMTLIFVIGCHVAWFGSNAGYSSSSYPSYLAVYPLML